MVTVQTLADLDLGRPLVRAALATYLANVLRFDSHGVTNRAPSFPRLQDALDCFALGVGFGEIISRE